MYNIGIYCDAVYCKVMDRSSCLVPTQISWNRQVKFLVSQGKSEAFKSTLGNWIMDVWQPKTNRVTRRGYMVIRDPVPEVQFCYEEADTGIVFHARHACRNDSVMHSDTPTLRLMSLSYCLLKAKTWLRKGATWKRDEARTFYANRLR